MLMIWTAAAAVAGGCVLSRWYLEEKSPQETKGTHRWEFHPFYNSGAGFGGKRLRGKGLIAASLGTMAALLAFAVRNAGGLGRLGAGLALGGGLSNLWERLRYGTVFDYLRFPKAPGKAKRWIFNLADAAILGGGALLLLDSLRRKT